jgi:putative MATE family efflux protein
MDDKPQQQQQPKIHGRDLTTGSIPRHLVMFSLPMLAGAFLQTAYSFVNAIWVGKFLGKTALAAVAVSFPVIFVLIALGAGMTIATTILVSQYYGARNFRELRRVVQSSVLLVGSLACVLFVIGEFAAPHILKAMDTPPEVLGLAQSYMRVFLITLPMMFGIFLIRSMLQGIGDSKTPLYFLTASLVINTVLDPVLMFGWLGLPKLGLNGTAWASVVSQAAAFVALLYYLHRKKSLVSPDWAHLRGDWGVVWNIVKIGFPAAIQQGLISIGMVFVLRAVNGFGENASAAFGAASRIDQLAFMPAMTFSMAVSTLTGQNIGAGAYHRVKDVFKWGIVLSGGATLLASLVAVCFSRMLIRIFVEDPDVVAIGVHYLHIVGASYIFFGIMFVGNGVINGSGHTTIITIMSLVSQWLFRVPLAYYLSARYHTVTGVWVAIAISFFVSMTICLTYYFSGRWKRPVIRKYPVMITPETEFGDETGEI